MRTGSVCRVCCFSQYCRSMTPLVQHAPVAQTCNCPLHIAVLRILHRAAQRRWAGFSNVSQVRRKSRIRHRPLAACRGVYDVRYILWCSCFMRSTLRLQCHDRSQVLFIGFHDFTIAIPYGTEPVWMALASVSGRQTPLLSDTNCRLGDARAPCGAFQANIQLGPLLQQPKHLTSADVGCSAHTSPRHICSRLCKTLASEHTFGERWTAANQSPKHNLSAFGLASSHSRL